MISSILMAIGGLGFVNYYGNEIIWSSFYKILYWLVLFEIGFDLLLIYLERNRNRPIIQGREHYFSNKDEDEPRSEILLFMSISFLAFSILPIADLFISGQLSLSTLFLIALFMAGLFAYIFSAFDAFLIGMQELVTSTLVIVVVPLIIINLYGLEFHRMIIFILFFILLQDLPAQIIHNLYKWVIKKESTKGSFYQGAKPLVSLNFSKTLVIAGYAWLLFTIFTGNIHTKLLNILFVIPTSAAGIYYIQRSKDNMRMYFGLARLLLRLSVLFTQAIFIFVFWSI